MNLLSKWLESVGQNPRTFLRDAVLFVVKFYVVIWVVLLPIPLMTFLMKPRPGAPGGLVAAAPLKAGTPQFALFMVGFCIYLPCAVAVAIALLGSWFRLSRRYPAPRRFREGQKFMWQSAGIGSLMGGYENILTIRVAPQGLYLSCPCLTWLLHRPILIPWTEIKASWHKKMGLKQVLFLTVGAPKIATVVLVKKNLIAAVEPFIAHTERPQR